jgi:hypothetical protein
MNAPSSVVFLLLRCLDRNMVYRTKCHFASLCSFHFFVSYHSSAWYLLQFVEIMQVTQSASELQRYPPNTRGFAFHYYLGSDSFLSIAAFV